MIGQTRDAHGIVTLTLPDTPAGGLGPDTALTGALVAAVHAALAEPGLAGIVVTADGEAFARPDWSRAPAWRGAAPGTVRAMAAPFAEALRALETAGVPVIAALPGGASGPGLDLALACHHRIAADARGTSFACPETGLGLIPMGGGIQRLARTIGLRPALDMLLEGQTPDAAQARALGLLDATVPAADLGAAARDRIARTDARGQPWDRPGFAPPGGGIEAPANHRHLVARNARVQAADSGNHPARLAVLSCLFEGLRLPMAAALAVEARHFAALWPGNTAQNRIRTETVSLPAARRLAGRPSDVAVFAPHRIGVLGAGLMGAGIAQVAAAAGLEVVLVDRDTATAEAGRARIGAELDRAVARGRMTPADRDAALTRLHAGADAAALAGCEAIIEAVFEDRATKAQATASAIAAAGGDVLFATNTSKLPIAGLAKAAPRPDRFVGMHFFSPVPRMDLVEIVRGARTATDTLAQAMDLARRLGKTPVVVDDRRGFFTSRVFSAYVDEGLRLLAEGVPPALIENAGRQAGMPQGPLATCDGIGLDLMKAVRVAERADLGAAYLPGPDWEVLHRMVDAEGRTGRKGGAGFYDYPRDGAPRLWPGLAGLHPTVADPPGAAAIGRRLLYAQVCEALRARADGVITDLRAGDVASRLGWGFPAHAGGVFSFVDLVGLPDFVATAETLAKAAGPRFALPDGFAARHAGGGLLVPDADTTPRGASAAAMAAP